MACADGVGGVAGVLVAPAEDGVPDGVVSRDEVPGKVFTVLPGVPPVAP
jgi:hypothetical protein